MGDRGNRGQAAVLFFPGVPAGAVPAAGGQGHRQPGTTWTTRLLANATLFALAPPRTGKPGRPRLKGARPGKPGDLAADATWRQTTACRYGRTGAIQVAEAGCTWYGSFGNIPGRCVLVREPASAKPYDLALFTIDTARGATEAVERYATRWPIEPSNAAGKQQTGAGQARSRLPKAAERTVPFGMLTQSPVITWYVVSGYHPDDMAARRQASVVRRQDRTVLRGHAHQAPQDPHRCQDFRHPPRPRRPRDIA